MKNTLPFSKKYADFFAATANERHVFLQGGRRSGKTFATFRHLSILASVVLASGKKNYLTILVATYQYPQLQATIADFEQAVGGKPVGSTVTGLHALTHQGRVVWVFKAFDDYTKAQGSQCDYLFINEAVNMPEQVGTVLSMSVRSQIFYNYNPTKRFWGEKYQNKNNLLVTTWRDNDYLTPEQVGEFEAMRERALKPNATMFDEYSYRVYYLGDYATLVGSVFHNVKACTVQEYSGVAALECFGLDFGFVTAGDPTVLVGVKYHNNNIYVRGYIYERGLTNDRELAERLIDCGLNYATPIVADYGGMGRGRMNTLITADNGKWVDSPKLARGFSIIDAPKTQILDGLMQMNAADSIFVCGDAARAEFESYEMSESGKPRGADHAIDAARYAFIYLKRATA